MKMENCAEKTSKGTENSSRKYFFHMNKEMLRFKIHFFLFEGGTASVTPFIPVVAKNNLGLSATSLAVILASQQLITIVSKPIIGYLADYFNRLKLMIILLIIIQTVSLFLILAIPPLKKSTSLPHLSEAEQHTNFNKPSKLLFVRIYPSPGSNTSTSPTFSNTLDKKESEWHVENDMFIDAVCVPCTNSTELLCLQNKTNETITEVKYKEELNGSCSTIHSGNFTDATQLCNVTVNLNLVLFYPLSSIYPTPCTMKLTLDNDYLPDTPRQLDISDFETIEFWMFAVVKTIAGICVSSIFSLSDTACCESIQKSGGEFGRQRLFGAIGWGILAAIGGLICDVTSGYLASWIFMAVLQLIAVWNMSRLDLVKPRFSQSLLKDIGQVLRSVKFTVFEMGVFFNGIGAGLVWFYLIWFLSSLGASKFLCGLTQYVQCFVGELPFMFFADWFIRKLGHTNLISLSLLSYALRFLWYSYLQNPWLVLPAEITHGFTYGTLFPTIVSYGKLRAKPGTEATTQSILFMTHGGLGAGLGCILAGICFDRIGPHQTFFYVSLMCSCAAALNILISFYFKRHNTKVLLVTST